MYRSIFFCNAIFREGDSNLSKDHVFLIFLANQKLQHNFNESSDIQSDIESIYRKCHLQTLNLKILMLKQFER